jgi:hypothetical protein
MKVLRIAGLVIFMLSLVAFVGFDRYEAYRKDTLEPEITFENDSLTVSVNATEQELLQDVTAFDQKEGDVTASVIIEKISKFTSPGKRTITYAAFDSSNNVAKKDRESVYSDYTAPRYSLSQPLIFNVGEDDILKYLTVTDCIDGDLSGNIKYDEKSYTFGDYEGTYETKFMVTNSAGDTAYLPVDVEFRYPGYEKSEYIPKLLLKEYLVYCKMGKAFNAWNYIDKVLLGNTTYTILPGVADGVTTISRSNISVKSNVNIGQAGVYEVNYSMTTEEGYTGNTKLIVVMEE